MADEKGFEPSKRYKRLPVFKTGAINRSATHPYFDYIGFFLYCKRSYVIKTKRLYRIVFPANI